MSVLVYAESPKGQLKKAAQEAVFYGYNVAKMLGKECIALTFGNVTDAAQLGVYGASKVLNVSDASLNHFDSQVISDAIAQVAKQVGAEVVVLAQNANGKALVGRLGINLQAGTVAGANALPNIDSGKFTVTKSVFSGKAFSTTEILTAVKVISLMGNSIKPEKVGQPCSVETASIQVKTPKIVVKEVKTVEGKVPLPEAEVVVSAGRGMKGPENWGIIEQLADALGATTACSRPVADAHWRPHHEHVGQTGIAIRPNLYFAIGISGAIQHLAGVNNSKVIVVINKDPEAPFFKAADYGVCGDLFEIVPKLTEAIQKFKAAHS